MRESVGAAAGATGGDRAQLSLTVVEGVVATLLVLAVGAAIGLAPHAATPAGLDDRAAAAADVLEDAPSESTGTLLGAACASPGDFDARAGRLRAVLAASVPDGAFVALRTPVGTVGTPPPDGARVGTATVVAPDCTGTLVVWYP